MGAGNPLAAAGAHNALPRANGGNGQAYIFVSAGGTSGATDSSAGDLILATGTSTGAGLAKIRLQCAAATTSGSADNFIIDRHVIPSPLVLANSNTNTAMFSISVPNGLAGGLVVNWSVIGSGASSASACCAGTQFISVANQSGTLNVNNAASTSGLAATGGATVSTTPVVLTTSGTTLTFNLNPNPTGTTSCIGYVDIINLSEMTLTIL